MSPLIAFIVRNMSIGAAIGSACWLAILWNFDDLSGNYQLMPILLGLWGFSSLFAGAYLSTTLAALSESGN